MRWKQVCSELSTFRIVLLGCSLALLLNPTAGLADSIAPSSFSTTLGLGESTTISKTVTVTQGRPTSALVDIIFMADTTGSMAGQISSAQIGAGSILSTLSSLGSVKFGVGFYGDPSGGLTQNLTSNTLAVTSAINGWAAGVPEGGGDFPEANLIGWTNVANDASWTDGSRRFIVTFGDAPGHVGGVYGTEAQAISALNAEGIQMEIINTGTATSGMNSPVDGEPDGQANRFADATGGEVFNGFNSDGTAAAIINAVTSAFQTYNTVSLDVVGNLPGVGVSVSGPITGAFDRSITRTFDYTVTFTGLTGGTHNFSINALVDGGIVATESDRITVAGGGGGSPVPEPSTLLLFGAGLVGLGFARYRQHS
ncbi:MAG: PEP-CTERM sorting domain-containing protein [Nitrospira sp.]|nr:PEP-CTERM sorting domain-containing protein [Nitrospira sp.]